MYCINFNMLLSTQPWRDRIFMTSIKYLTIGSIWLGHVRSWVLPSCRLAFLRHFSEITTQLSGLCCLLDSIQEPSSPFQICLPPMCLLATVDHNSRAKRSSKKWEVAKLTASKGGLLVLFFKLRKKMIPWVRLEKDLVLIHIKKKSVSSCYSKY